MHLCVESLKTSCRFGSLLPCGSHKWSSWGSAVGTFTYWAILSAQNNSLLLKNNFSWLKKKKKKKLGFHCLVLAGFKLKRSACLPSVSRLLRPKVCRCTQECQILELELEMSVASCGCWEDSDGSFEGAVAVHAPHHQSICPARLSFHFVMTTKSLCNSDSCFGLSSAWVTGIKPSQTASNLLSTMLTPAHTQPLEIAL